ncbi:response regulator [Phenylobacterium sp.]|uniref:response regulator n=1 Tax=Phenylobacterium sp. TaxID=1871053 RepID=UPI002F42A37E
MGVVIWVVAISVAFGFYLPFLRTGRRLFLRPAHQWLEVEEDLDHASMPLGTAAFGDFVVARAPATAVSPPALPQAPVLDAPELHGPELHGPEPEVIEPRAAEPQPFAVAAEADAPPAAAPEQFSVLIVDDNAINRQVLEMILDSVGMAHVSVENGLEAVTAMRDTAYDAILMDLQMPVMDGFEATRRIRELEARRGARHSTIIVVSANCLDEHVAAGREAGADAHLAKPISAGDLIGQLASCPTVNRMAA